MPFPMIPVAVGLAALGLGALLFSPKKAAARVPSPQPQPPRAPEPQFKPSPPPVPTVVPAGTKVGNTVFVEPPIVMRGKTPEQAMQAAVDHQAATGKTVVFQTNPDEKSVQVAPGKVVMPELTVLGMPTPSEAAVKSGSASDPGKGQRTGKEYFKWVQNSLNSPGAGPTKLAKLDPDGAFGPKSKARTQEYQRNRGLEPDGIVGLNTETKLSVDASMLPPWALK